MYVCFQVLRCSLSNLVSDTKLLYPLMQYLKKLGSVHLLQFCMCVDNFNGRLLKPEISPAIAKELWKEAWDIYTTYLKPDSADVVPCSPDLHESFRLGMTFYFTL